VEETPLYIIKARLLISKGGIGMSKRIIINKQDEERLNKLVTDILQLENNGKEHVRDLEKELEKAKALAPKKIPADVVTMNTRVILEIGDEGEEEEEEEYTLVYPGEADIVRNKISVTAPIGTAILGFREGDVVEWRVPEGNANIKIIKIVYQPEAAGDWDR
jgi:regulator of nucleoside diphosphate kinase